MLLVHIVLLVSQKHQLKDNKKPLHKYHITYDDVTNPTTMTINGLIKSFLCSGAGSHEKKTTKNKITK